MSKKIVCLAIALFMVFGLAACSTETPTESATESASDGSTEQPAESEITETSPEVTFPEMTLVFSTEESEESIIGEGIRIFMDYVEDATDGNVKIETHFNSSLFDQAEGLNQLMQGNVDFITAGLDFIIEYRPEIATFYVPFVFQSWEHYCAFFESDDAKEYLDDIAEELGIRWFQMSGYRGVRTINLTVDKKITSRADLQGITMRFPNTDATQRIGEAMGCNPIPMAFSDVYLALQTGSVSGQDNPLSTTIDASFYEVTESVTVTGHQISATPYVINEERWQSMSPELQQIILDGVKLGYDYCTETAMESEEEYVSFLEEKGLSVYYLTDEEKASYAEEVQEYYFAQTEWMADVDMDLFDAIQKYLP